jgi:hypothetical protein
VRVLLAAALSVILAGCGGSARERVRAFALGMPHGVTRSEQSVAVAGNPVAVYIGRVSVRRGSWTCLGGGLAARYRRSEAGVLVGIDDAANTCDAPALVRFVGGYAPRGGYVGEWLPGAVVYR